MTHYQLFPRLEPATEAALRASIERFGVIVPITLDQHGNILDGHHRKRIAEELGVECEVIVHQVRSEDEANEIARTLNMDRRHLSTEDRRRMVEALRPNHSLRAIARALGVSAKTIHQDVHSSGVTQVTPETVRGTDGKQYPARRAEPVPQPSEDLDSDAPLWNDEPEDDAAWRAQQVEEAEWAARDIEKTYGVTVHIEDVSEPEPAPEPRTPMAVPKKTVADGIPPHPATYPEAIIDIFREAIPTGSRVLDPFAGVGTIHQLRPDIETHGIEIEVKWAAANPLTTIGNSRHAHQIFAGQMFDVIATSPAYGNRLADSYNASDPQARHSYSIDLGQSLEDDNAGGLHFDTDGRYEELHEAVWASVVSLLKPGGLFLLNCKDFKRDGRIMRPTAWHIRTLSAMGMRVTDLWTLPAKGLAFTNAAPLSELVVALEK